MNRCPSCGKTGVTRTVERLPFNEVAVVEGVVYTCSACGTRFDGFARVDELSRVVAQHIARREERLTQQEIRFLRKSLGYSSKDFAAFLDVAPETLSRWESKASTAAMPLATEKLLRLLVISSHAALGSAASRAHSKRALRPLFRDEHGAWTVAS
jgi:putative zinc finger/helix-turn-helix YgiT family protein